MADAVGTSPWHRGELEAQKRAGVDPAHTAKVSAFQRTFLNDQHRAFYPRLPFLVVGAVDDDDRPWATILDGEVGFLQAIDDMHLRVASRVRDGDPAAPGLRAGRAVGLLGIELETRRRNRLNGHVTRGDADALTIAVDRAYGNCPKYIHTRDLAFVPDDPRQDTAPERLDALDDEARATIARSGTFFVASYADEPARAVDVSHRGGRPGFVDVEADWLTIPDFSGNQFFNTLGNFVVNPKAGLLFPDFVTGDVLQLSGSVDVLFDSPRLASFEGAQRLWRFHVERVVRRRGMLRWRGAVRDGAAEAEADITGTWAEARARAATLGHRGWRPVRVERVADEAHDVRSYTLRPMSADHFASGDAGMHLVLRLPAQPGGDALIRSYSLSRMPADGSYRISIKDGGVGARAFRQRLREDLVIEARGPQGEFVVDLASTRPVVLMSAGIGITPMLAMAEQLVDADPQRATKRRIHFIHGARDGASMPFGDEIAALQARSGGLLVVTRCFSRPRAEDRRGVDFECAGHLTIDVLRHALPFDDHDFYLCGPAAFMQQMYDGLRGMGIDEAAEAFGPSSLKRAAGEGAGVPAAIDRAPAVAAVPVRFARSGVAATWAPGSGSLLELAERSGLEPEYGCRDGSCGTCRSGVLRGEVAYPGRAAPSGPAGTALICCSVPAADSEADGGVELDL